MLDENIKVVDIDALHWLHLFELLSGRAFDERKGEKGRKKPARLFVIHEQGKVLKALDSEQGLITDKLRHIDLSGLEKLEELFGAGTIFLVERGAPRRFMQVVQRRLSLSQNYIEQLLEMYQVFRQMVESREFYIHPPLPLRDIRYAGLFNLFKLALPEDKLVVLVVFSGEHKDLSSLPIYTSLIFRVRKGHFIDLLTTTDHLARFGLSVSNWRQDYHRVIRLCEQRLGEVFLGIFTSLSAIIELQREFAKQGMGIFNRFLKEDKIILNPFPLRLKMLLKMAGRFKR